MEPTVYHAPMLHGQQHRAISREIRGAIYRKSYLASLPKESPLISKLPSMKSV